MHWDSLSSSLSPYLFPFRRFLVVFVDFTEFVFTSDLKIVQHCLRHPENFMFDSVRFFPRISELV